MEIPVAAGRRSPDVILLHPAGSRDPGTVSLAIGLLEWIRMWLESRSLSAYLWPETAVDAQGHRKFILRPIPWNAREIRRKIQLFPSATGILYLTLMDEVSPRATVTLEDRSGGRLAQIDMPLDPGGVFNNSPVVIREVLKELKRPPVEKSGADLFQTPDQGTAFASLYALERFVALHAGVGGEDPRRMFEPVLQCLAREPFNPIACECLTRMAATMAQVEKVEAQTAACDALQRWCDLAPLSAAPVYYLALARQRSGAAESARAAFEEALHRNPLYVPAVQGYADWLADRGFVDQGVGVLRQAFGHTKFDGNLFDQAGCLLANAGRLNEAEPFFRQAIQVGGPPTAHANLARNLLAHDREEEALAVLGEGIAMSLESSHLDLLAQMARRSGLAAAKARAVLRGRIAEGSSDEEILKTLTSLCLELDGPEAAAPKARRLLEMASKPEHRRYAFYVLLRDKISDFEGRWDEAVQKVTENQPGVAEAFFREVVAAEPGFGRAQFMLAAALELLGRTREGLPHIEQAALTEGEDPVILDLLARARADAGDLAGAAQAHHRAAYIAPQDPRILRNAAVTLLRAGYIEEGGNLARISLALDPEQPELLDLLRQLGTPKKRTARRILDRAQGLIRKSRRPT